MLHITEDYLKLFKCFTFEEVSVVLFWRLHYGLLVSHDGLKRCFKSYSAVLGVNVEPEMKMIVLLREKH